MQDRLLIKCKRAILLELVSVHRRQLLSSVSFEHELQGPCTSCALEAVSRLSLHPRGSVRLGFNAAAETGWSWRQELEHEAKVQVQGEV